MDFAQLTQFTNTNDWLAIWPSLTLALLALGLLVLELALPAGKQGWIPRIAILGQLIILLVPWVAGVRVMEERTLFGGLIEQSPVTDAVRSFFLLGSIGVSYLGLIYLKKQRLPRVEFFHLVLVVTAAMLLLVQSAHFVMLFVALEAVTVGFYILVAYCRTSALSLEAGLKYLVLGGVSSAILLFGIVLLYGAAGNPTLPGHTTDAMNFRELASFLALNSGNVVAMAGATLVIAGIAFKIGAVPFQIWIPDVYQGAPTPVTAFLAVASKSAGFLVLLSLVLGPFEALAGSLMLPLISAMAVVTILFGNLAALPQRNVKRLMGLSGIAHAGYLLVGVAACVAAADVGDGALLGDSLGAVYFYLLTYLLGSFAVFGVMAHVAGTADDVQEREDYVRLAERNPTLGLVLAAGLGSLAGIPPLAGFMGKLLLLIVAFRAGLEALVVVTILGVVISIGYYFGWVREAFFQTGESETPAKTATAISLGRWDYVTLGGFAAATLVLGLYQGGIGVWILGL